MSPFSRRRARPCCWLAVAVPLLLALAQLLACAHAERQPSTSGRTARRLLLGLQQPGSGPAAPAHPPPVQGWEWASWRSWVALALATANSVTAAATGQGGAPLLIPIFSGLLSLSTNHAVAVATLVVALGATPSLYHAAAARHPSDPGRPLVDYTFLALVTPPLLVGIRAGVMLNKISPPWFISWLLIAVYGQSTYKQLTGTLRMRRKERAMNELAAKMESDVAELEAAAASGDSGDTKQGAAGSPSSLEQQQRLEELQGDVQRLVDLSRAVVRHEAQILPLQSLDLTTTATIRSALDSLWLEPANEHRHPVALGAPPPSRALSSAGSMRRPFWVAEAAAAGPPPLSRVARRSLSMPSRASASEGLEAAPPYARSSSANSRPRGAALAGRRRHGAASPAATIGVATDAQQLVQLGHVLGQAPTLTRRLNRAGSSRRQRHDLVRHLVCDSDAAPLLLADGQQQPQQGGGGATPAGAGSHASPFASSTAGSLRSPLSSVLLQPGSLRRLDSIASSAGAPAELAEVEEDKQGAGGGEAPAGRLARPAAALRRWVAGGAAEARGWWAIQPRRLLLLVVATYVAYLAVCTSMALLPRCRPAFYAVQGAFLAVAAALCAYATLLNWPPRGAGGAGGAAAAGAPGAQPAAEVVAASAVSEADNSSPFLASMLLAGGGSADGDEPADAEAAVGAPDAAAAAAAVRPQRRSASSHAESGRSPGSTVEAEKQQQEEVGQRAAGQQAVLVDTAYEEIQWTAARLLYFPPLMVVIGVLSGALGASPNNLFLTPLLMSFGQHPQVSSATLKVVLFISSSTSAVAYLLAYSPANSHAVLSYGLAFGVAGLLTTPLGQWLVDWWVRRTGCPSAIYVIAVARNLLAIPLLIWINGVPGIIDLVRGTNVSFHPARICL